MLFSLYIAALFSSIVYYYPPLKLINFIQNKTGVIFRADTNQKCIALTFDDVPYDNDSIHDILEILSEFKVVATFFCLGSHADKYVNTVTKILRNGHEIENHGMYDRMAARLSEEVFTKDIEQTDKILSEYGVQTKFYRPGCGLFTPFILKKCTEMGKKVVLGDVYPHDPQIRSSYINKKFIESKITNGSIIILHDRRWTPALLKELIPLLVKEGYQFCRLDQLL